jgi:hypothetical protein
VPGWVEKHPDVLLRLGLSHRGSQGERFSDRGFEVADLDVPGASWPMGQPSNSEDTPSADISQRPVTPV